MTAELKHTLTLAPVNPDDVYEDAEDSTVGPTWEIRSLDSAEWALKRSGELRRQVAENKERAETEIARIRARLEAINAPLERGVRFFESRLRLYAETNRAALLGSGKKKSRDLLYGTIGWRTKPATLAVKDEAAFLEWCKDTGCTRIKTEPSLTRAKKHLEELGEIPAGTEPVPEHDEFYVKGE